MTLQPSFEADNFARLGLGSALITSSRSFD